MMSGRKKACDTCHARKIHCDGALPSCDWCSHQGLVCTFDRGTGKDAVLKSRSTRRDITREKHGFSLVVEALPLAPLSPTRSSSLLDISVPVPAASSQGSLNPPHNSYPASISWAHTASDLLSPPPETCGSSLLSFSGGDWVLKETIKNPTLDLFSSVIGPPWEREHNYNPVLGIEATVVELPDKNITDQYLQLFRSTPFRQVFPIVDAVLFRSTIDLAYEPGGGSISSRACVFSFLSIMAHTQWTPRSSAVVDGAACARQAELLMELVSSKVNIVALQFHIMQCMYQLFSGNLQAATMYHAIACRIIFKLGGHLGTQPTAQDRTTPGRIDREQRTQIQLRKLFWLGYTFDKILALRTGQPPCIDDEQCDLSLPFGYVEMLYSEGNFDTTPSPALCSYPGDLRLSIIKSRTCKLLDSIKAQKLPDAEVLRIVREVDGELEKWRLSIPLDYRPILSCRDDGHGFDPAMDSTQKMHIVIIHLEYHHLMATIHRVASRSICNRENSNDLVYKDLGISSSQTLSVEASRATLEYLRAAAHALFGPIFWIIVFYPMNAILTLVENVLQHPLEPQAEHDMELLDFTADLIKRIRNQKDIPIDISSMVRMDAFVVEVIQRGKCAIAAAGMHRDDRSILYGPM